MHTLRVLGLLGSMALWVAVTACDDDGGPGDGVNVTGNWSGTALLPNGFGASMTLQQTGSAVTGEFSITGAFIDATITGEVNSTNRTFTWDVADGCELWSGVLNIDSAEESMSGALQIDRSGCQPPQSNGSGTLSIDRQ